MRILVLPELYRASEWTTNGTVNDVLSWVRQWLHRDPHLHVYLLVPESPTGDDHGWTDVVSNQRVTVIRAEPAFADLDRRAPFTDTGYSTAQLRALRRAIADAGSYVDVVVDQHRFGRETLYKWLLDERDHWAARVQPFDVIVNVHDLQTPAKYRYASYRNDYQFRMEAAGAAFADGVWFTAGVDETAYREQTGFLDADVVADTLEDAVVAGSPIEFGRFDERYADAPEWLHLAGSFWAKKNVDRLFEIAETLHERFGIRTLLTSVEPIPDRYRRPTWVEAHAEASRETYEWALDRGDITVHASDYETMARTPIEQAASGQIVVLRDVAWARECTPESHCLRVPMDELEGATVAAVENWDRAVEANRRVVSHNRETRAPEACGRRTYRDVRRRVDEKLERYGDGKRRDVVERTVGDTVDRISIAELNERTEAHTDDGRPLTDHDEYAFIDLVYTLRDLGFVDSGNEGTPVFERSG